VASATGTALGKSPFEISWKFFLDATDGRYEADGRIKNISADQLNPVSKPIAGIQLNSLQLHDVAFHVNGNDNNAVSDVQMTYNDLYLTIKKTDTATGAVKTNSFATKVVNRLALRHNNPEKGYQKNASGVSVLRISSQSFFGLLWKSVFAGIQSIIMKAS
jgi:hypothetical protein